MQQRDTVTAGICRACRLWQQVVWLQCTALGSPLLPVEVSGEFEHDVLRHCFILTIDAAQAATNR